MSFYSDMFDSDSTPSQGNVRHWLDTLYSEMQPFGQARWNQANIDSLFMAGCQEFVNRYFNFNPGTNGSKYYFNIIQQPVNMVTGYERQHRKGFIYVPTEGADVQTTDQYTKLVTHVANAGCVHEQKSKAKELAAVSGMCLLQPYLDYTDKDPAQGELKIKIWEYNSFLVDPHFRSPDMSDCGVIWCQEYITKKKAEAIFDDKKELIKSMSASPKQYGNFYFLPENHYVSKKKLMVLSYVWHKKNTKKKKLYSKSRNQFYDFSPNADLESILYNIQDFSLITVDSSVWNLSVILNDQLLFQGENPLGFSDCPLVPYFWNYDPHLTQPDLQVRSLVRTMRDPQFLFNYKIITNNDIASATINAGWKRKIGAVANEDNLKRAGQGWDVVINEGFELTDCEKIIPSAVPESDMALGEQMKSLIYETSGINTENWSGQDDLSISSLSILLKQAANLMVLQKYFDQWDLSDKLAGSLILKILINNWSAQKVALYIGEEPTAFFYSKIFSNYQCIVEETDLTATQQNLQAKHMMDINAAFGREVFSPSQLVDKFNITGKAEIKNILQGQEQQAQQMQQEQHLFQQHMEDAQVKELYSRAVSNLSMAKERVGRYDANVGLLEERLSEISKNQALSTKSKMEALEKMVDVIGKYGEIEAASKINDIQNLSNEEALREDEERKKAAMVSQGSSFLDKILSFTYQNQQNAEEQTQQAQQEEAPQGAPVE